MSLGAERIEALVASESEFALHVARQVSARIDSGEIRPEAWEWDGWDYPDSALQGRTREATVRCGRLDVTVSHHRPAKGEDDTWDWIYSIKIRNQGRMVAAWRSDNAGNDVSRLVERVDRVAEQLNQGDRRDFLAEFG